MKDTFCPKCRTHLILAGNIENSKWIKCSTCNLSFENPHYSKPSSPPIINLNEIKTFFDKKNTKGNSFNAIISVVVVIIIFIVIFKYSKEEPTTKIKNKRTEFSSNKIRMKYRNGICLIPIYVNGVLMDFIFDTGASSISISTTEAVFLIKQGTLTNDDIIGSSSFSDATGKISIGTTIILREVRIGSNILTNVKATVVDNPNAPLLLGQTALSRFGKISIDYNKKEISFE